MFTQTLPNTADCNIKAMEIWKFIEYLLIISIEFRLICSFQDKDVRVNQPMAKFHNNPLVVLTQAN